MLEPTTIKQTALDYLLSNLEIFPEHRHLFEFGGTTCFDHNEWMINISIVGLVAQRNRAVLKDTASHIKRRGFLWLRKYWNVFGDGNTGKISLDWEFNSDCQDCNEPHQYSHLPDYLNQLLDRLTIKLVREPEFGIRKGTGSKLKIATNPANLPYVKRHGSAINSKKFLKLRIELRIIREKSSDRHWFFSVT